MKYKVFRSFSVWDVHEIEATSKEKAKEIAYELPITAYNYIDDSTIITDNDISEISDEQPNCP